VLDIELSEATGHVTPSMKIKRAQVAEDFTKEIEALYSKAD